MRAKYVHAGVRGFTSLSDYGSRTLLLVDGLADELLQRVVTPLLSPLIWDFFAITTYLTGSTLFLAATTKEPVMSYLFAASFLVLAGHRQHARLRPAVEALGRVAPEQDVAVRIGDHDRPREHVEDAARVAAAVEPDAFVHIVADDLDHAASTSPRSCSDSTSSSTSSTVRSRFAEGIL